MIRFLSYLFSVLFFVLVAGLIAVMLLISHYNKDLPNTFELEHYQPSTSTRIHASDGRLLDEFAIEHRVFVPIEVIPKQVIQAFIAAEDKNFYSHPGIDVSGIVRAVFVNIKNFSTGKRLVGASTITQQVARNFFLSDEVSFDRKIKEAILSFKLENTYSKEKLLELYLNQIYLGRGSYGVAAAALSYFDKSLDDLSVEEVAYLAALPKGPNNYHPKKNFAAAMNRRDWVLSRMYEDGYITQDQMNMALRVPLETVDRTQSPDIVRADYFVEEVRRTLVKLYGSDVFYKDGLSVRTTLDPLLQKYAVDALREGLESYDRRHGWRGPVTHLAAADIELQLDKLDNFAQNANYAGKKLAVVTQIENQQAHIKFSSHAMGIIGFDSVSWARKVIPGKGLAGAPKTMSDVLSVGDVIWVEPKKEEPAKKTDKPKSSEATADHGLVRYDLKQIPRVQGAIVVLDPHTGRVLSLVGGYNYDQSEFDRATQALRQPGSSFKPFVYLTALQNGFTPTTKIIDGAFSYSQGAGMPTWSPNNISKEFYGPTTLRVGIEKSRNAMTVRLAYFVGIDKVAQTAQDFGVIDNMPHMLSMSLGAGETTLLKMVNAYGMFVNGGRKITPHFIEKVQDRHGKVIFREDDRACASCMNLDWQELASHTDMVLPQLYDHREQVVDPRYAYQIVSLLEGVVQRGTGRRVAMDNHHIGGKTGTSSDLKDVWFIGFTPDLVAGVFVGFDEPRSLGGSETGSRVAAPIFKLFMEKALKNVKDTPFRVPLGMTQVRVDPATGELSDGPRAIWESYIPDTEPGANITEIQDTGEDGYEVIDQSHQYEQEPSHIGTDEDPIIWHSEPVGNSEDGDNSFQPSTSSDDSPSYQPQTYQPLTGTGGLY